MLESFPNTTLVWAHCSVSHRVKIEGLHELIDRLLCEYNESVRTELETDTSDQNGRVKST